ncbi:hypothetical protein AKJ16_DCAP20800 [Drosera capensis]
MGYDYLVSCVSVLYGDIQCLGGYAEVVLGGKRSSVQSRSEKLNQLVWQTRGGSFKYEMHSNKLLMDVCLGCAHSRILADDLLYNLRTLKGGNGNCNLSVRWQLLLVKDNGLGDLRASTSCRKDGKMCNLNKIAQKHGNETLERLKVDRLTAASIWTLNC